MKWQDFIEVRPDVALGKPVFRGTRLTVDFILERLSDGATIEELVQNYVGLTPAHIRAAIAHAEAVRR